MDWARGYIFFLDICTNVQYLGDDPEVFDLLRFACFSMTEETMMGGEVPCPVH